MTNKDIKDKIENDFGWLTPDEKQKLNSLLISVWNDAVNGIADVANITITKNGQIIGETYSYTHYNSNNDKICCSINRTPINALKLKL